jgi:ribosomal protein S3AE
MNLMVLTKDIKKQNTNIILKVVDVKGTSAKTEIKG